MSLDEHYGTSGQKSARVKPSQLTLLPKKNKETVINCAEYETNLLWLAVLVEEQSGFDK